MIWSCYGRIILCHMLRWRWWWWWWWWWWYGNTMILILEVATIRDPQNGGLTNQNRDQLGSRIVNTDENGNRDADPFHIILLNDCKNSCGSYKHNTIYPTSYKPDTISRMVISHSYGTGPIYRWFMMIYIWSTKKYCCWFNPYESPCSIPLKSSNPVTTSTGGKKTC